MAHGLEARSPFMDHKVAEFVARLPARLKVRGRKLRYAQVLLARRHLPPEVLSRRKQGFASALPYLLKDELRVLYHAFLSDSHLARAGFFRSRAILDLVEDHVTGRSDHGQRLWLLVNSEVWFRMFIENQSETEISAEILRSSRRHEFPSVQIT